MAAKCWTIRHEGELLDDLIYPNEDAAGAIADATTGTVLALYFEAQPEHQASDARIESIIAWFDERNGYEAFGPTVTDQLRELAAATQPGEPS
ncbi:MAG: hypothetical protein ABIQ90_06750 [Polaromonas sp.]